MTLLERVISGLHAVRRTPRVRLVRAHRETVAEVADWLRTYISEDGAYVWKNDGDQRRRVFGARLLVLREQFSEAWRERGGR